MTDLGKSTRKPRATWGRGITERPRSKPVPHSEDDFVTRIQLALDLTPKQLAAALGLSYEAVVDRYGSRASMSSFIDDPFWDKLLDYVDNRLAGFLAVKEELERKKRLDEREASERRKVILERGRRR